MTPPTTPPIMAPIGVLPSPAGEGVGDTDGDTSRVTVITIVRPPLTEAIVSSFVAAEVFGCDSTPADDGSAEVVGENSTPTEDGSAVGFEIAFDVAGACEVAVAGTAARIDFSSRAASFVYRLNTYHRSLYPQSHHPDSHHLGCTDLPHNIL